MARLAADLDSALELIDCAEFVGANEYLLAVVRKAEPRLTRRAT